MVSLGALCVRGLAEILSVPLISVGRTPSVSLFWRSASSSGLLQPVTHTILQVKRVIQGHSLLLAVGLRHGITEASPQPIHDSLVWSQDIAGIPSKGCVMVEQVQLRQGGAWNGAPTATRWVQWPSDRSYQLRGGKEVSLDA